MINEQLINPKSIAVIGGSNNIQKPGGKILHNLLDGNFKGEIFVLNPKEKEVQGVKAYQDIESLPQSDLAIIAIAARFAIDTVESLLRKGTKAFIIISAGFGEESDEGKKIEAKLSDLIDTNNASLIGPNCIGVLNENYSGVFTTPIPIIDSSGVDFVSSSGATAVFIMEKAMLRGMRFNSVYSVGNAAQTGIEDVLEYWDNTYSEEKSAKTKLMYIENINDPGKLLRHAKSLINKGCKIAAIKSGVSEAGSRAASSHTGAMASSDLAVRGLFRKAGIVYCSSREELIAAGSVFNYKELKGKNIAIITHAGGPAVMLTDALSKRGLNIPEIKGEAADNLLNELYPGSSVKNPIDFLATGTAEQLGTIIDYVNNEFDEIDGMAVVFGSPGLFNVDEVYKVLNEKIKTTKKPIFPVLPSLINAAEEVRNFQAAGNINFPDEVMLGEALAEVWKQTHKPLPLEFDKPTLDKKVIREVIDNAEEGYISSSEIMKILDASGIERAQEKVVKTVDDAIVTATKYGFPLVMKVVGPVHKSDVGGVVLNVRNEETVIEEFNRMIRIKQTTGILMQPMLSGMDLFAGTIAEDKFGHQVMAGLGGIFIEVLKDVQSGLAPLSLHEIKAMLKRLNGYKLLEGVRGQEGINIEKYIDVIQRLSVLVTIAPEIKEMDLNPLLGTKDKVIAVDARIRIEKI
ncbi:MAG: acetate--CoA ligase family protein [Flavobacteriales bacterium]|nr:acetate--CoA ligase family protein [Flavobacteriales bacterium]